MNELMRIGSSAMSAAAAQLETTGQNIANAATPGYVRREVQIGESGSMSQDGWAPRGVDVLGVRRVYDEALTREAASAKAGAAQDAARTDLLQRLDTLFADSETGAGAVFDDLMGAFSEVVARPTDPSARQAAVTRAETFAQRVVGLDQRIMDLRESANRQKAQDVGRANEVLQALADLNVRFEQNRNASGPPNGLFDERERLLSELNGIIRAQATVEANGKVAVQTASGEALLVGGLASRLTIEADAVDASKMHVAVIRPSGQSVQLEEGGVGGRLAGLMRFSGQDVDAVRAQLGRLAASAAWSLNAEHMRGLDANGNPGRALFAIGAPTADRVQGGAGGATLSVQISDGTQLAASDYQITRLQDGLVRSMASLPATMDGLSLSLGSGAPAVGDRFIVRAATNYSAGMRGLLNQGSLLATAAPVAVEPGAANQGDVRAAAIEVDTLGVNTRETVTVTFLSPTTFSVSGTGTGNPANIAYTPGMTISYNGWSMTLDGQPQAGDILSVGATRHPLADNRNARGLLALGDAPIAGGGAVIDRYAELVGDVGVRTRAAQTSQNLSQRMADEAERLRGQVSDVNLDEEAARLMEYQQAYQAAAKVLAAANEMFRSLLNATTGG
jgi:flagellar hook-associated protein 1 FlgK